VRELLPDQKRRSPRSRMRHRDQRCEMTANDIDRMQRAASPRNLCQVAQFLAVCRASIRAEELYMPSPLSSPSRENTGA